MFSQLLRKAYESTNSGARKKEERKWDSESVGLDRLTVKKFRLEQRRTEAESAVARSLDTTAGTPGSLMSRLRTDVSAGTAR